MYFTEIYLQFKVIKFTNDFIYNYDFKMLRGGIQATNVPPNDKWELFGSIHLCHILNMSFRVPLWHVARKKVKLLSKKKEDYQFQVGCTSK